MIGIEKKRQKFIQKNKKKSFQGKVFEGKICVVELLSRSRDVSIVHEPFTRKF